MSESLGRSRRGRREGIIGAVGAGAFLILAGVIILATPNVTEKVTEFFRDFVAMQVPNTSITFFAPDHPARHVVIYSAAATFALAWGIFQIVLLALRFYFRSPINKKADNVGDILFWLGAYYLNITLLNEMTTTTIWFAFWSEILILAGLTLIVRAVILAAERLRY